MAHTFKTLPLGILLDRGIRFKKHFVKREYSFGKTAASGPGGLDCPCCNCRMGNFRNSIAKPKMRRYVRRINKMNVVKEIAFEMDALNKEFEALMNELSYDYDDYDYYDPWDSYCYDDVANYEDFGIYPAGY